MSRGRRSKLNAQISEEAAEWFVEFRSGDVDLEARRQFDAWVRSSPEHLRAYLEIAAIWNESDALSPPGALRLEQEAEPLSNIIDLEDALRPAAPVTDTRAFTFSSPSPFISSRGGLPLDVATSRSHSQPRRRLLAIAASVAAVVIGVLGMFGYQLTQPPLYTTQAGEHR